MDPVKCLVVDDLAENLLAFSALLTNDAAEVITAQSGAEALELLLRHEFALAILDVNMPEMSGFELAELMRGTERTKEIPIIFVSAAASDSHRLFRGYDSGAVDFLHKPVESHVLRSKAQTFFDIYRQRRLLAQRLAETTETLRLNELFVAALGHDLRNPLNAMLTSAQLLTGSSKEERTIAAARVIRSSGLRMARMISQLLDLARVRLGNGLILSCTEFDLGTTVEEVLRECAMLYPGRKVEFRRSGVFQTTGDADRLAQAVSNLVGNALQYSEASSTVTLQADGTDPARLVLVLTNAGEISQESLPTLFDPFTRASPSAQSADGLGIGLFLVRQIVQAHGGTVEVVSAQGQTTFTLVIPRTGQPHDAGLGAIQNKVRI
jgi:two-component system, sensor histidine kinase and response regulator